MSSTPIDSKTHLYFIGIGGISMSALALLFQSKGCRVSGTDIRQSPMTERLEKEGITVHIGHSAENITDDVSLVVYTAAIKGDNPELSAAREKKIPTMDRAHLLGEVMAEYHYSVAVAGTHGKTTTSSMVSEILLAADTDPTITIGGILPTIGSNLKIGHSPYFVAEACEYFDSFLQFKPLIGVILNIEADHLDYFKNLENIRHSFHSFACQIPADGILILPAAVSHPEEITASLACKWETFGIDEPANWQAKDIRHTSDGFSIFSLYYQGENLGEITLQIPGEHNICNALAACAAAHFLGLSFEDMARGLRHFHGTDRRFQKKGETDGVLVIDDYAHHPTEIRATLSAAKEIAQGKIWCVFQPHTYSRTKFLFDDFGNAFRDADHIIIADIYAAREAKDDSITAQMLAERIQSTGKDAAYVGDFSQILSHLHTHCQAGDLLLTVGAGDIYKVGEQFLKA